MSDIEKKQESEKEIIEKRKEKLMSFFKKDSSIIYYFILALVTWIGLYIRTVNINQLKDITTGSWTLGPDLDPFLFLRWAKYIVAHGSLFAFDSMRYVPLGFDTTAEMKLLSYFIAWFYKFLTFLPQSIISLLPGHPAEVSVNYAAVIYPVVMWMFTCIAFFFLVRKIFSKSFSNHHYPNIIALFAVFFMSVIPAILPRTIAGIPEKESTGFLLIFLSFYFLIYLFESKGYRNSFIYAMLAGISTAALGLIWGGITFVFMIAGVSVFIYFISGQMNKKALAGYVLWVAVFIILSNLISDRYTIIGLLFSTSTIPISFTIAASAFHIFIYPKIKEHKIIKKQRERFHISDEIVSIILVGIILLSLVLILKPTLISNQTIEVINQLVHPFGTSRVALTVAENQEPYYNNDWKNNFGPTIANIPIFFWMFIIGSIILFYNLLEHFEKKDRRLLTITYAIALFALIFSKSASDSILNGISLTSILVYFGGMVLFLLSCVYIGYKYNKENKKDLLKISFSQIIVFTMFFISIVAARGGVRLMMVLVPPVSIIAAYFVVVNFRTVKNTDNKTKKLLALGIAGLVLLGALYSGYIFYQSSNNQAQNFHPSVYQWQWQKAMSWVRDNTPQNAVFGHWWDYGYWLQSIGERATVLDGGNAINYWDYLMGREVLTTPDDKTALDFLYSHNTTHFLIDSTDIGKYSAFSSIGSDKNYDRLSYIPTFFMDTKSIRETKDGFVYIYPGQIRLEGDIVWEENGSQIYLPAESSGLLGIILQENTSGFSQPYGVYLYQQSKQIQIPLRYLYFNNTLHDFKSGLNSGVFVMETVDINNQNQVQTNPKGSLFYLSQRTIDSLLVRKYLFGEEGNFKLVHNEPHPIVNQLRASGLNVDDFISYQGGNFLGPIKIWKINYPAGLKVNQTYLQIDYPDPSLALSTR